MNWAKHHQSSLEANRVLPEHFFWFGVSIFDDFLPWEILPKKIGVPTLKPEFRGGGKNLTHHVTSIHIWEVNWSLIYSGRKTLREIIWDGKIHVIQFAPYLGKLRFTFENCQVSKFRTSNPKKNGQKVLPQNYPMAEQLGKYWAGPLGDFPWSAEGDFSAWLQKFTRDWAHICRKPGWFKNWRSKKIRMSDFMMNFWR